MCLTLGSKSKTESQVKALMESFKADPYPQKEEKHQLAKSINISHGDVEQWFCNIRHRTSKEGLLEKSQ